MTQLIWLLNWMLEDGKSTPSTEELAWRAACARFAKRAAFAVCALYVVWELGRFAARHTAQRFEALASVVWLGDASYEQGAPGYNGHASASHRVWQDGVHLLLDGIPEPGVSTTGPNGGLRDLSVGDRVRVRYRRGTWLFWEELSVMQVSKLDGGSKTQQP